MVKLVEEVSQLEAVATGEPQRVVTGVAHGRAKGVVHHREQEVHRMCRQHEEQQHIRIEDDVFEWVHRKA